MKNTMQNYLLGLVGIILFGVHLDAVSVNPSLCPTNKIAPHRRIASWENTRPRTLGAFYDLLTPAQVPNIPQYAPPPQPGRPRPPLNDLQEEPQKDEADDCGEIEDYDENDLSSLQQPTRPQRRQSDNSRLFFHGLHHQQNYPQRPQRPTQQQQYPGGSRPPIRPQQPQLQLPAARPPQPQRPNYPPTRPPYWSGGVFENNSYRPPIPQNPSDNIKPVHEGPSEIQMTYRPDVVGGPIGHVVGVNPARPTRRPLYDTEPQRAHYMRYPGSTEAIRQQRPRNLSNSNSILGSYIDLLFK